MQFNKLWIAKQYTLRGRPMTPEEIKQREQTTGIYSDDPELIAQNPGGTNNLTYELITKHEHPVVAHSYDEKGHLIDHHVKVEPSEILAEKQVEELINKEYTWQERVKLFFNKFAFWKPRINGIK